MTIYIYRKNLSDRLYVFSVENMTKEPPFHFTTSLSIELRIEKIKNMLMLKNMFFVLFSCLIFGCTNEQQEKKDLDLLSKIINAESNPNDIKDMWLIGSTVINRVESNLFPNSVFQVIVQPNQYKGYNTSLYKRSEWSDRVASIILGGDRDCDVYYFVGKDSSSDFYKKMIKSKPLHTTTSHYFWGIN